MDAVVMLWLGIAIIATVVLTALVAVLVIVRRDVDDPPLPPYKEHSHEP